MHVRTLTKRNDTRENSVGKSDNLTRNPFAKWRTTKTKRDKKTERSPPKRKEVRPMTTQKTEPNIYNTKCTHYYD